MANTDFLDQSTYFSQLDPLLFPSPADIPVPATSKRKSTGTTSSKKDSKTAHPDAQAHSHAQQNSSDEEDDDDAPGSATKGKKKGGTTDKRKEQNRIAQRNFRNRKENHLKELEDRLGSLEDLTRTSVTENVALKQLVQRLQQENERLLSQSKSTHQPLVTDKTGLVDAQFTFDAKRDVSTENIMPLSAAALRGLSQITGLAQPLPQPPVAPNAFNFATTFGQSSASPYNTFLPPPTNTRKASLQSTRKSSTPSTSYVDSPQDTTSGDNRTPPSVTDASSSCSLAGDQPQPVTPPAMLDFDYLLGGVTNDKPSDFASASPLDYNSDLFSSWRDPLPADTSLASAISPTDFNDFIGLNTYRNIPNSIPDAFDVDYDKLFQSVVNNPTPPTINTTPQYKEEHLQTASRMADSILEMRETDPERWQGIYEFFKKRPDGTMGTTPIHRTVPEYKAAFTDCPLAKNMDPGFDLDLLCSEMKTKATCQEAAKRAIEQAMKADQEFQNRQA